MQQSLGGRKYVKLVEVHECFSSSVGATVGVLVLACPYPVAEGPYVTSAEASLSIAMFFTTCSPFNTCI